MIRRVLIADDEAADRELMEETLRAIDEQLHLTTARDGEEACGLLEDESFDLVLTDLKMPRKGGLQVLEKALATSPGVQVVIVTGFADVPTAVESIKKGGFDYLLKPICIDQVEMLLRRVREHVRLVEENRYLHAELAGAGADIIGESRRRQGRCAARPSSWPPRTPPSCSRARAARARSWSPRRSTHSSPRRNGPFIGVNCAALPETLLESELFGHEQRRLHRRARAPSPGRFELADGGTLLPRRDRRPCRSAPGQAAARHRGEGVRARGRHPHACAWTCASSPPPTATWRRRWPRGASARTSTTASTWCPSCCRPCASGTRTCRCWSSISWASSPAGWASSRPALADRRRWAMFRRYPWPGNVRELENLVQRLVIMDTDGAIGADDVPEHLARPVGRRRGRVRRWAARWRTWSGT